MKPFYINEFIKELRSMADLTQEETSKLIDMDRQNYGNREKGKVDFSADEFFKLAVALSEKLNSDTFYDWFLDVLDKRDIDSNVLTARWIELITTKFPMWSNGTVTPNLFPEYRDLTREHETLKLKYESESEKFELQKNIIQSQKASIDALNSALEIAKRRIEDLENS